MQGYQNEDSFDLPVEYGGREILLPGKLVQMGYTYKIFIQTENGEITFEPDEERNLRAIVNYDGGKEIPVSLVQAIGAALEKQLR